MDRNPPECVASFLGWYARRPRDLVFTRPFVECLGCHVDAVGPGDGADLRVDAGLGEEGLIGEWLEHASPVTPSEVDIADEPILKGEAQLVVADYLNAGHVNELVHSRDFSAGTQDARQAS
jgi:hypothetical protein